MRQAFYHCALALLPPIHFFTIFALQSTELVELKPLPLGWWDKCPTTVHWHFCLQYIFFTIFALQLTYPVEFKPLPSGFCGNSTTFCGQFTSNNFLRFWLSWSQLDSNPCPSDDETSVSPLLLSLTSKTLTFWDFNSHEARGGSSTQTLALRIMKQVFYPCVTTPCQLCCHLLPPNDKGSAWPWTLNLEMMRQVLHHCAAVADLGPMLWNNTVVNYCSNFGLTFLRVKIPLQFTTIPW